MRNEYVYVSICLKYYVYRNGRMGNDCGIHVVARFFTARRYVFITPKHLIQ